MERLEDRLLLSFAPPVSYPVGPDPRSLALGDFNQDGMQDLVAADYSLGTVSVLPGRGDGTFGSGASAVVGIQARAMTVADLNGDGKSDLMAVNYIFAGAVDVLLGNGDGTFQPSVVYAAGAFPHSVTFGDFNNDGRLDLATANDGLGPGSVSILLGNGDGTFQPRLDFPAGNVAYSIATSDFNGDARADLVVSNLTTASVNVLLGNGDGTFQPAISYAVGTSPYTVAVGDFDGDGRPDLVTSNALSNSVSVLLGNGDGTFRSAADYATGTGPVWVSVGDIDEDGRADLAVAEYNSGSVGVLLGNGDGTFQPRTASSAGQFPQAVVLGDFQGTGHVDLATVNVTASVSVLLNQTRVPTTTTVTAANGPTIYGQTAIFTATVMASNGLTPGGQVQFVVDGADLGASVALAGGVAVLAVDTLPAGIHAVTARYLPVAGFSPSGTISPAFHEVRPARLTITTTARSRSYGLPNPAFEVTYSGFVLGQRPSDLRGTLSFDTAATPFSRVGFYPVTPVGLSSSNYEVTTVGALLTVTPAPVIVTLASSRVDPASGRVVLIAQVKPADPGSALGSPGGAVTFMLDGLRLGSSPVLGGRASLVATLSQTGVHRFTATYVSNGGFASAASPSVAQSARTVVAAPVVRGLAAFPDRDQRTRLLLSFSTPLDSVRAAAQANYRIVDAGRDQRFGTRDDRTVRLSSVSYDARTHSVTIRTSRVLSPVGTYLLVVNATPPRGVASATGVPLDGAKNGHPGTSYIARLDGPSRNGSR